MYFKRTLLAAALPLMFTFTGAAQACNSNSLTFIPPVIQPWWPKKTWARP